jgi:hypothetical protein
VRFWLGRIEDLWDDEGMVGYRDDMERGVVSPADMRWVGVLGMKRL